MQTRRRWLRITAAVQIPILVLGQFASCGSPGGEAPSTSEQLARLDVSDDAGAVEPLEGCVAHVPDGNTYAVFAYRNHLDQTVIVPPENNRMEPNLEQPPTAFLPGLGAFAVTLGDQHGIVWQLDGRDVSVEIGGSPCDLQQDWSSGGWQIAIGRELIRVRIPEEPPAINALPPIVDTEEIPSDDQQRRTVGNTPGELAVSDDGAARYSIPIRVPTGRRGIAPSLGFSYNSRGGNGLLGVGWSLSGLSSIHRCAKTHVTHGEVSNVRFERDGAYCLDGEQLVPVGSAAPQTPWLREYRTEDDRFARVVMDAEDAEGPTSWTVYTKDGRVHRYGSRGASVVGGWQVVPNVKRPATTTDVEHPRRVRFSWSLAETMDRTGNRMTFDYDLEDPCASGPWLGADCGVEHVPREVRWTYGNAHPYANRAVRFHYEARPDLAGHYVSGLKLHQRKRMSTVEVIGPKGTGEATVRTYRLMYQTAAVSSRSLLRSIQECDPTGVCLQPTEFEWDMGDAEFEKVEVDLPDVAYFLNFYETKPVVPDSANTNYKSVPVPQGQWWALVIVDVNGDGRDDLLYRKPTRRIPYDEWLKVDRWGQQLDGADVEFGWYFRLAGEGGAAFGPPQLAGLPYQGAWAFGEQKEIPRPMDIDGDGRTDLAFPGEYTAVGSPPWKYRPWTWYRSTGSGYVPVTTSAETNLTGIDPINTGTSIFLRTPHMVVTDLDGDHVPDPVRNNLRAWSSGTPLMAWAFGRNGAAGPSSYENLFETGSYFHSPGVHASNVYAADVDGSGRRAFVFPSRETDALSGETTDEGWYRAALASRVGSLPTLPLVNLPRATNDPYGLRYLFLDVNGDGISDALEIPNTSTFGFAIWPKIAMNTGSVGQAFGPAGFLPAVPAMAGTPDPFSPHGFPEHETGVDPALRVLDYNQDGKSDVLMLGHTPAVVFQSTTDGLTLAKYLTYPGLGAVPEVTSSTGHGLSQLLDFDGDGLTDFTSLVTGPNWMVYPPAPGDYLEVGTYKPEWYSLNLYRRKGNRADMITTIHDGLTRRATGSHRIEYRAHHGRASVATSYPITPVTRGLWVVARIWSDTATEGPTDDGYAQTRYWYADGLTDVRGRGWLGFRQTTAMHVPTGTVTTKEFTKNHIRFGTHYPFAGRPTTVTTEVTPLGMPPHLRQSTFTYSVISGAPFFLRSSYAVAETQRIDVERQGVDRRESETQTHYDRFGNVTYRMSWNVGPTPAYEEEEITVDNREDIWLLGMVTDHVVVSSVAGDTMRRHLRRQYDVLTGDVVIEEREPGDPALHLDTTTVRNVEGLPAAVKVGSLPRWTTYSYDADGIEVVKNTNALGHVTSTVKDRALGVPTRTTDENGVVTRYQYDRFGRLRAAIPAAGPTIEAHYSQASSALTVTERSATGAESRRDHDRLGRVVRTSSLMMDGASWRTIETTYDKRFRDLPSAVSRPFSTPSERLFTKYAYDDLGRRTRITHPDGSRAVSTYSLSMQTSVDERGRRHATDIDDLGLVSRAADTTDDGSETSVRFAYGAFRQPTKVFDAKGNVLELRYDALGRVIEHRDPDRGVERFEYDETDEVSSVATPEGATTIVRDLLGRAVARSDKDGTATYTWDASPNGVGKIASATTSDGVVVSYDYDVAARPIRTQYTISGATYDVENTYDWLGRVDATTYPAVGATPRFRVHRGYAPNGEWQSTSAPATGTTFWRAEQRNSDGQITSELFGNGLRTRRTFDLQRGFLASVDTGASIGPGSMGSVQAVRYAHDVDGNLLTRTDLRTTGGPQTETFEYDALDRLTGWSITGTGHVTFAYDVLGNLTDRTTTRSTGLEHESFAYKKIDAGGRPVGPHALTHASYGEFAYDAAGQQIAAPGRIVEFRGDGKPRRIEASGGVTELSYDAFQDRVEKRSTSGTTVYAGGLYERRSTPSGTEHVFLVAGAERAIAEVTWLETAAGTTSHTRYLHDERQGHVTAITSSSGAVIERLRFDPYGRRVDPDDPLTGAGAPASHVHRGYTSHEHDDEIGLVNMKGRMYDPLAMRFISPDPVTAEPLRTQAYNRYAYVMNNPTRYTDPSGHVPQGGSQLPQETWCDSNCTLKEGMPGSPALSKCEGIGHYSPNFPAVDDNGQSNRNRESAQHGSSAQAPADGARSSSAFVWLSWPSNSVDYYEPIREVNVSSSKTVNEIIAGGVGLWNGVGSLANIVPEAAAGMGIVIDAVGDVMGSRQAAHDLSWMVGAGEVEALVEGTGHVLRSLNGVGRSAAFLFTGAGGGAYLNIRRPLRHAHEMPSAKALKDSAGFHPFTPRVDAPAISMHPTDHMFTPSHGVWGEQAAEFSAKQAELIREGRLLDAMKMDIDAIRANPGWRKYEPAIRSYCEYVWGVLSQ